MAIRRRGKSASNEQSMTKRVFLLSGACLLLYTVVNG